MANKKWEYKVIREAKLQPLEVALCELGAEGWELVQIIWFDNGFARYYFKRENKW